MSADRAEDRSEARARTGGEGRGATAGMSSKRNVLLVGAVAVILMVAANTRTWVSGTVTDAVLQSAHTDASGSKAAPAGTASEPRVAQTVVHQGESLWAVAKRVAPGHDPRAVVDQIADLNDLSSDALRPGQLLTIPAS